MKKAILGSLFLFLFFPLTYSQLTLNPSKFSVEIVGGENITKTISLVWKGEAPVVAFLGYEIEQVNGSFSGSEMRVEFSENPVILEPNKVKKVEVTIATKPSIYPGEYLVRIFANTSVEQVVKKETSTRIVIKQVNVTVPKNITEIKWYENTTKIEILEDRLKDYMEQVQRLENKIREKDEIIKSYRGKTMLLFGIIMCGLVVLAIAETISLASRPQS